MSKALATRKIGDLEFAQSESGQFTLLRSFKPVLPIGKIVMGPRSTTIEFNPRKLSAVGTLTMTKEQVVALADLFAIMADMLTGDPDRADG